MTGTRCCTPEEVRCALPVMLTCGMYDYSGQWAFEVGIPAKSGVGGCIFMVVPNLAGISIWSPRVDKVGNSVRGIAVAKALVDKIEIHNFEVFSGLSGRRNNIRSKRHLEAM
jgi:glutaminase